MEYLMARLRDQDKKLLKRHLDQLAAGERTFLDIAVRVQRFDRTWAWILLRGRGYPEGGDEFGGEESPVGDRLVIGVAVEVSRLRLDKRFFPASLDDTETTYQTLLEHSPNNIIRFDRELFPLYMNPSVTSFVAHPLEDLGAKKAAELGVDISSLEFLQDHVDRVFDTGQVCKSRRSVMTPKGLVVGEFTFWPEFDAKGVVRSVISQQQDLTAEVLREREAYTNELRFSALYELTQMNDTPEEEVIRFVVEKIAELTGSKYGHLHMLSGSLTDGEHIIWSKSHDELFAAEELAAPDAALVRLEFGLGIEAEPQEAFCWNAAVTNSANLFFKGKLSISRFLCAPAVEDGKPACVAAVYNKPTEYTDEDVRQLQTFINGAWLVLQRRRHIEQLKKTKESAELANKVKDRFLANVSHELRTPLNGLLSMLQLLELSFLTPEQREYAQNATITGQTLLRIISDILDFSKMESGTLELAQQPFDLEGTIFSTVELFRRSAHGKGLALKLTKVGSFPRTVVGDEARVRQILFNLVGNSLKFTETGEIEVFCEAKPETKERFFMRLSVRDTGIGIPVDMQDKVFDAFTQVDGSSTRKHQGSGLGLGIVRQLTTVMGGSVSLLSTPGNGTLVECLVPFLLPPGAADKGVEKGFHDANDALPECPVLTVLVAEDDAVSRHAMRLFLEKLGHTAVCVGNGREALEALRLFPFDCLISDVLMPEMDGLEVTRRIRKGLADEVSPSDAVRDLVRKAMPENTFAGESQNTPVDIPIVAVSAHAMKGDKEYFLEQGMDYYLSKPMKISDLAETLILVCRRKDAKPRATPPEAADCEVRGDADAGLFVDRSIVSRD